MLFVLLDASDWKTAGQRMGRLVFWEAIFIDVFLRPKPLRKDIGIAMGLLKVIKNLSDPPLIPTKKKDMNAFPKKL